jgi:hypothetical protein
MGRISSLWCLRSVLSGWANNVKIIGCPSEECHGPFDPSSGLGTDRILDANLFFEFVLRSGNTAFLTLWRWTFLHFGRYLTYSSGRWAVLWVMFTPNPSSCLSLIISLLLLLFCRIHKESVPHYWLMACLSALSFSWEMILEASSPSGTDCPSSFLTLSLLFSLPPRPFSLSFSQPPPPFSLTFFSCF